MDEVGRFRAGRHRYRFGIAPVALLVALLAVFIYYHWLRTTSVESLVRSRVDPGATCDKAGVMAFAGTSTNVYQCDTVGVSEWRCFVRVRGDLYEVTNQIHAAKSLGDKDARAFRCG